MNADDLKSGSWEHCPGIRRHMPFLAIDVIRMYKHDTSELLLMPLSSGEEQYTFRACI
jgi:hypothetical protein